MYPVADSRWTDDDRARWWALITDLRERADRLEYVAMGAKDLAVGLLDVG